MSVTNNLLFAPDSYWLSDPKIKEQVVNGCGPGGWKFDIIPDSIFFLSIHDACDIHDWMYTIGQTNADKDEADRVFLNNCLRLINEAGGCSLVKYIRRIKAKEYYEAVHLFGGPAFWTGKNPPETLCVG